MVPEHLQDDNNILIHIHIHIWFILKCMRKMYVLISCDRVSSDGALQGGRYTSVVRTRSAIWRQERGTCAPPAASRSAWKWGCPQMVVHSILSFLNTQQARKKLFSYLAPFLANSGFWDCFIEWFRHLWSQVDAILSVYGQTLTLVAWSWC